MFSSQNWKFSYTLAAAIGSIFALLSVVHFFLYPVVPSLDYFSLSQAQISCLPVDGSTEGVKKSTPKNGSIRGGKMIFPANGSIQVTNEDADQNLQTVVDLNVQFPADLHNSVSYHGAPWKAEIGRWLSGCNSNTKVVKMVEVLYVMTFRDISSKLFQLSSFDLINGFGNQLCLL